MQRFTYITPTSDSIILSFFYYTIRLSLCHCAFPYSKREKITSYPLSFRISNACLNLIRHKSNRSLLSMQLHRL